ncbi:MAG: SWIM zinc finger family protein [Verrucomicrobiota bacterium]
MSWYSFKPYVPVAERRRKAAAAAKRLTAKNGHAPAPVKLTTKKIATTFWGKAWCDNLESYSDYENRLPRGRSYVRNGSVVDLQITEGRVTALVQGSSLYKIAIGFQPLAPQRWKEIKARSTGKVTNLLDLLQGRLSKEILADITAKNTGLFPAPKEIELNCSCPDWADMCKHVAAALYGVGSRLDEKPELFFTLRGVDVGELITAASASAVAPHPAANTANAALDGENLAEIFGVEMEPTASPEAATRTPANTLKPAWKITASVRKLKPKARGATRKRHRKSTGL